MTRLQFCALGRPRNYRKGHAFKNRPESLQLRRSHINYRSVGKSKWKSRLISSRMRTDLARRRARRLSPFSFKSRASRSTSYSSRVQGSRHIPYRQRSRYKARAGEGLRRLQEAPFFVLSRAFKEQRFLTMYAFCVHYYALCVDPRS